MAEPLVVFGSGGHAKVVIEAALARNPCRTIILLDDAPERQNYSVLRIQVSGDRTDLRSIRGTPVVPAIGENAARARLLNWLHQEGHIVETVIHPSAVVGNSVRIDPGAFISAGATVIAEAAIGAGAIVNTGATIDHDCVIGEAAHVGPGAHLCGNVCVGTRALIGVGTSIRPGISICKDAVIGAGSVVVRHIAEAGIFAGNPARRLR